MRSPRPLSSARSPSSGTPCVSSPCLRRARRKARVGSCSAPGIAASSTSAAPSRRPPRSPSWCPSTWGPPSPPLRKKQKYSSPRSPRARASVTCPRPLHTPRPACILPLAGEEQFYVEGSLPEVAEEEEIGRPRCIDGDASLDAGLEQNEPSLIEAAATGPESPAPDRARPAAPRRPSRPAFADRARGSFAARDRRAPSGDRAPRREGGFRRPQRSGDRASGTGRPPFRRAEGAEGAGAEGTARPPRPNFERRARPSFGRSDRPVALIVSVPAVLQARAPIVRSSRSDRPDSGRPARSGGFARPGSAGKRFGSSARPSSGRFERGGPTRGGFNKPGAFGKPRTFSSRGSFDRGGSFDKDRPARPAGGSFRRDKPAGDYPPEAHPDSSRTGEGAERPRFRPAGTGSPRFGQNRPGRPPARAGERPSRPFRAGATGTGEGRSSLHAPDRPFRKPFGDRPAAGPRRFDSRPPRRDGPSRPQGDRPFKRPYSPAGARPPRPAPRPAAAAGGPASSGRRAHVHAPPTPGGRPLTAGKRRARSAPLPRRWSASRRIQQARWTARLFQQAQLRQARLPEARSRRNKNGQTPLDRSPSLIAPQFDRHSPTAPALPVPHSAQASVLPRLPMRPQPHAKPGGFRKPAGPGKSFGRPRPAGASSGRPRPQGQGRVAPPPRQAPASRAVPADSISRVPVARPSPAPAALANPAAVLRQRGQAGWVQAWLQSRREASRRHGSTQTQTARRGGRRLSE